MAKQPLAATAAPKPGPTAAATSPPPVPAKKTVNRDQILRSVEINVPVVEAPAAYGWAMTALAAFLVLIPLFYLTVLLFLGWLCYFHIGQTFATFKHGPYFIFHLPMAILGGTLLVFLVKPVFFRSRRSDAGVITLNRTDEPLLFGFVEKLCEATGSTVPEAIEVDCDPNAGAIPQRGRFFSIIRGKMVLRIGLPLIAAISVRQLAGVLAHELGHFRQTSGLLTSFLIRQLVNFFAQIVFQRDRLDEKLERMRSRRSGLGRLIFWTLGWLIEAARGVLWVMFIIGHLLTCWALRRMEYDADTVEAHVAGTRDFIRTSKLLLFLSIASRRAHNDLADAWQQHRLADDFPKLIVAHARQLAEYRKDILKFLDEQCTNWFDTHPCHNDRVKNVQQVGAPGLVDCDASAKYLFADFGALCKRATVAVYQVYLGEDFATAKLIPTAELVEQRSGERSAFKALRRFYQSGAAPTRPILPGPEADTAPTREEEGALAQELIESRDAMVQLAPAAVMVSDQYEVQNATAAMARGKLELVQIFYMAPPAAKLRREAEREQSQAEPQRARAIEDLLPFEKAARRRLTCALRLAMRQPAGAPASTSKQVATLVVICSTLELFLEIIEQLREQAHTLRVLFSAFDEAQPYGPLIEKIVKTGEQMVATLTRIKTDLAGMPYPFQHAVEGCSIGDALVEKLPEATDPAAIHSVALTVIDRFYDLLYRSLAVLTEHAEKVEIAIGLPALPEPPEKEDKEAEDAERKEAKRDARRYWVGYGLRAAGGMAMLFLLVRFSIVPPSLPSMGWGEGRRGYSNAPSYRYRPAPFTFSGGSPPPSVYVPSYGGGSPYGPSYPGPSYPGTPGYRPPGYQPPQPPGYQPPRPPNYNRPDYTQPRSPTRTPPGGYQPPSPYSPSPYTPAPYSPPGGGAGGPSPGRR